MMVCEACGSNKSHVKDTRKSKVLPNCIWRRRKCARCGTKWSSIEIAGDFAKFMWKEYEKYRQARNDETFKT